MLKFSFLQKSAWDSVYSYLKIETDTNICGKLIIWSWTGIYTLGDSTHCKYLDNNLHIICCSNKYQVHYIKDALNSVQFSLII